MTKKKILVDMDQILVNLNDKWLKVHNEENDENVTMADITTWEMENHVKTGKEIYKIIERPGFFDDLPPLPGAIKGFKALRNSGHTVAVCSSPASDDSARAKIAWCKAYLDIDRRDVIIMHKKYWLTGTCDVLIDDKPDNILKWSAAGKTAMTIAYPYNEDVAEYCAVYAEGYKDTEAAWATLVAALT